jgi:hypothetical protein
MVDPVTLYTPTMADLYARQGYLRKAAEIYRHLLAGEPRQELYLAALRRIEEKIAVQEAPSRKEIGLLLREWVEMMKQNSGMKP